MSSKVLGGGRYLRVYAATNGATPTIGTLLYTNRSQLDTSFAQNAEGNWTITPNQVDDSQELYDFLRANKPAPGTGTAPETLTYEDGLTEVNASATAVTLFVIAASGVTSGDDVDTKKLWAGFATVDPTSGGWSQTANTFNKPALVLTSVALEGDLTVTSAVQLGMAAATTPATFTLDADLDKYGKVFFA